MKLKTGVPFFVLLLTELVIPAIGSAQPRSFDFVPSRYPAICAGVWGTPQMIDCYLNDPSNQQIAEVLLWTFQDPKPATLNWSQWPDSAKADLRKVFQDTVSWYKSGMSVYPGTLPADPPVAINTPAMKAGQTGIAPIINGKNAWSLYLGHVALNLASEIYEWVPWSVHSYDAWSLRYLFESRFNLSDRGGYQLTGSATPAPATYVFHFLKTNFLIGANRRETIEGVLNWTRQLSHSLGSGTWQNAYYHWQYWGMAPISRVIEGTFNTDPDHNYGAQLGLRHWTDGCDGTTAVLEWLLRAVNIPVRNVSAGGGHRAPYFMSEDLYLSHGDDPYDRAATEAPTSLLLITKRQYDFWFPENDPAYAASNTGRRPVELALKYPGSEYIIGRFCSDVKAGRSHADSLVYKETFKNFYTVAQVEAAGLWLKLPALAQCSN